MVALGVLCFAAPTALFGPDSYRIPVRVSMGLLGAVAGGLGVAALLAAATGTSDTLRTVTSALLVVTAIAPAVVLYNIGYFDTVATSGVRALSLSVGIVLGAGVPLILNLGVLHRLPQPAGGQYGARARLAPRRRGRPAGPNLPLGHKSQSGLLRPAPGPSNGPLPQLVGPGSLASDVADPPRRLRAGCAWYPSKLTAPVAVTVPVGPWRCASHCECFPSRPVIITGSTQGHASLRGTLRPLSSRTRRSTRL